MAVIDFPASPIVGQIYTNAGRSWIWTGTVWNAYSVGVPTISASDGPPASALPNEMWYETDSGKTYIYYDGGWVEMTSAPSGIAAASLSGDTLPSNIVNSSLKYVPSIIYRTYVGSQINVPGGSSPVVAEIFPAPAIPNGSLVVCEMTIVASQPAAGVFDVLFTPGAIGGISHQYPSGAPSSNGITNYTGTYIANGLANAIQMVVNAWGGQAVKVNSGTNILVTVYGPGRF